MKLSVGILARNEEKHIRKTIGSLLEQSVFSAEHEHIDTEIVVIPNGCQDDTTRFAKRALKKHQTNLEVDYTWKVSEIAIGSRTAAWNHFVHRASSRGSDFLVLVDADIEMHDPHTLFNLVHGLSEQQDATICMSEAIKWHHVSSRPKSTLMERLSRPSAFSSLYCARSKFLRSFWLPLGLPEEDGFIWQAAISDNFSAAPNPRRVIAAPGAQHFLEGATSFRKVLHHESQTLMGMTVNDYLSGHLSQIARNQAVGEWIRQRNEEDPQWVVSFVRSSIKGRRFPIHLRWLFRRAGNLKFHSLRRGLRRMPLHLAALPFEALILMAANRKISTGLGR